MNNVPSFKEAKQAGFSFPYAKEWILPNNKRSLARDAALVSTPNIGVPVEFSAFIDPLVIEILTAPRNARELFGETQKGDWTTLYDKWTVKEYTGTTQPYDDESTGTSSGVNTAFLSREQYVFQTNIIYGDRETAVSSLAKINLASEKQQSAARTIDIDSNKFYLRGVAGKNIYGILNDPNLPSATAVTSWGAKSAKDIYNDILVNLFSKLASNSAGYINNTTPLILAVSPAMNVKLGTVSEYNVTVEESLKKYFSSLKIIILPELATASVAAGEIIYMIAPEVAGMPAAQLAFGEKFRAGRLVSDVSSFRQKFIGTTYGGIVYLPFAFASIIGMDATSTLGGYYVMSDEPEEEGS